MVRVLSLSAVDVSTRGLTPGEHRAAFGVWLGLVAVKPPRPISISTSAPVLLEAAPKGISGSTSYLSV